MKTKTLVVSRAEILFHHLKKRFEQLGFSDVILTGEDKDSLNMLIKEVNPRLLCIGSGFYQVATPYMIGRLHKRFPKLNIAAISVCDFPISLAPWFIWHGATSYINIWEGLEEFYRGLDIVKDGRPYISPLVQKLIDYHAEWPDTRNSITLRQQECLILSCCGFPMERIGEEMQITRQTVHNHIKSLFKTFHVSSREELTAIAWQLQLVTAKDIRFYSRKNVFDQLPEWAAIKIKNEKILLGMRRENDY